MRLLQGIVALAGPNGVILTPTPSSKSGVQLRLMLEPDFDALDQDALVVKESMSRLLAEIGLSDGGDNIKSLKASLIRMANVTVVVRKGTRQASFHMLSYAFDDADGRLYVALNPRIAEAVMGQKPHTRIELAEVRALDADPSRLIHQRLCGWIDPGKSGKVELDTLCAYVWPSEAAGSTMRMRRQAARRAVDELRGIGWTVTEYATAKFEVCRPSVVSLTLPRSFIDAVQRENGFLP